MSHHEERFASANEHYAELIWTAGVIEMILVVVKKDVPRATRLSRRGDAWLTYAYGGGVKEVGARFDFDTGELQAPDHDLRMLGLGPCMALQRLAVRLRDLLRDGQPETVQVES